MKSTFPLELINFSPAIRWDFEKQDPQVCYRDRRFGHTEKKPETEAAIKEKIQSFYPKMKGIRISYGNSSNKKLLFTPHVSKQLLTFFEWGEESPRNCFELLAGLAGFRAENLLVVEHILPGNLENRSETMAAFSTQNLNDILKEVQLLNLGRAHSHEKFKLSEATSLVGIAHTHPLALSAVPSIPAPCCGSGGMFVQSAKFIENHSGNLRNISVFGQDSNPTTWKMAQMNLAIRGIEANLGSYNADTFFNDCHPTLRADFIMANPPFNLSDWGADKLKDDVR